MAKHLPMQGLKSAAPELHEKVTKASQAYMDGDQGPFRCDNCDFFHVGGGASNDAGTCELVEGRIDPAGCCNSFKKKD